MQHAFLHPWLLLALLLLPVLSVLAWLAQRSRHQRLVLLLGPLAAARLRRQRPARLRPILLALGWICLVVGAAGPRWGRDWRQSTAQGRDIVAVVDLSRSMFAGAPSRVLLARLALLDLADEVGRRGGHRLGLVVFAGVPRLICPLTHDVDHFRACLLDLDTEVPDTSLQAGTRIGAALSFALETFEGRPANSRDLLLLTDGDDPARDGEFLLGAEKARSEGIPVHVVGLGDANEGQKIPDGKGWLLYAGAPVRTRLEEAPLREIARRTGGELLLPGTRPLALGATYQALAQRAEEDSPDRLPVLRQRQEWFLLPALILLTLALALPSWCGNSTLGDPP